MITFILSCIAWKFDIWCARIRYNEIVSENRRKLTRFIMWYIVFSVLVICVFKPSFKVKEKSYILVEQDGKYIHHNIGSSSNAPIIDVLNILNKDSYIENETFVYIDDNNKVVKLPIESYDLIIKNDATPSISYSHCEYDDFNIIEQALYFPSGIYLKDYNANMTITLSKEE